MEEEEIREKLKVIFPEAKEIRFGGTDEGIMGRYVYVIFPNETTRDEQVDTYTQTPPKEVTYVAFYPASGKPKATAAGEQQSNAGIFIPHIYKKSAQDYILKVSTEAEAKLRFGAGSP